MVEGGRPVLPAGRRGLWLRLQYASDRRRLECALSHLRLEVADDRHQPCHRTGNWRARRSRQPQYPGANYGNDPGQSLRASLSQRTPHRVFSRSNKSPRPPACRSVAGIIRLNKRPRRERRHRDWTRPKVWLLRPTHRGLTSCEPPGPDFSPARQIGLINTGALTRCSVPLRGASRFNDFPRLPRNF